VIPNIAHLRLQPVEGVYEDGATPTDHVVLGYHDHVPAMKDNKSLFYLTFPRLARGGGGGKHLRRPPITRIRHLSPTNSPSFSITLACEFCVLHVARA